MEFDENQPLPGEADFQPAFEMIHHMKVITETPEVVATALGLLRARMDKINEALGKKGDSAKVVPVEILSDDKYLIKFLRVMKYDTKRTAKLLVSHWDFKVDVLKLPKKM